GGPVPFWTAISKLCQIGGLTYQSSNDSGFGGRASGGLRITMGPQDNGPSCDSGPFRSNLVSIHHHRDRSLTARTGAATFMRQGGGAPLVVGGQSLSEDFHIQMQIWAEPRLLITLEGPPKLLEAV